MPLTQKGLNILSSMSKMYGPKKGKEVFYASRNSGKISGVDPESGGDSEGERMGTHGGAGAPRRPRGLGRLGPK